MKKRLRTALSLLSLCGILSLALPPVAALDTPAVTDECYVMGDKTYRVTSVAADEAALGMPASWNGVSPYLEPSETVAERPVYHTGLYLAVDITLNHTSASLASVQSLTARFGEFGENVVRLDTALGIAGKGTGTYRGLIDPAAYNIADGTVWYGTLSDMSYITFTVTRYALVTVEEVAETYTVDGVSYAVNQVAENEAALGFSSRAVHDGDSPYIEPSVKPAYMDSYWLCYDFTITQGSDSPGAEIGVTARFGPFGEYTVALHTLLGSPSGLSAGRYRGMVNLSAYFRQTGQNVASGTDYYGTLLSLGALYGGSVVFDRYALVTANEVKVLQEIYRQGDAFYRITNRVAEAEELGMPALWDGSSPYAEPSVPPSSRPAYRAGYYLLVDINVIFTNNSLSEIKEISARFGSSGETAIRVDTALGITGTGRYQGIIDIGSYGVSTGTTWYGTYLDLPYVQIEVTRYELVEAVAVDSHTVTFYDADNQVLQTGLVAEGEAAVPPADPVKIGYLFTGWSADFSEVTADLQVYPQYTRDSGAPNYTVTAVSATVGEGGSSAVYQLADSCTVTASLTPEAGKVIGWTMQTSSGSGIIGYGSAYTFTVTGDCTLTASLMDAEVPAIFADPTVQSAGSGDTAALYFGLYSTLPASCTAVEYGLLCLPGLALSADEVMTLSTSGVQVWEASAPAFRQQYVAVRTAADYLALRPYLTYRDEEDALHTVYGNSFTCGEEEAYLPSFIDLSANSRLGVWWWVGNDLADPNTRAYLNFLQKNGVTDIYGGFDAGSYANTAAFIEAANDRGMRVSALGGDSSWVDANPNGFDAYLEAYTAYQAWAAANGRGQLYAMHLDVEPYVPSEDRRVEIWGNYADLVEEAYTATRTAGVRLEWCTSAWLDGYTSDGREIVADNVAPGTYDMTMAEWVMRHSDSVVLMSYRDSAAVTYEISEEEIALASQISGGFLTLGVETGPENDGVTYQEEGKQYLYQQLSLLYDMVVEDLPGGAFGLAIHNVQTWYDLPWTAAS